MNISAPFIRRPVATSLLILGLALASAVAYFELPIAPLPDVEYPTIVVTTTMPGASAEITASTITTPLESALGQIPSLDQLSSVSGRGVSQITLRFTADRELGAAEQDVQAAIQGASALLPSDLPAPPTYAKANPADAPILTIAVSSNTLSLREVDDRADAVLAQRISQVRGVGLVAIRGGLRPAVRVQADVQALAGVGLTLEDLRVAIGRANVHLPTGNLDGERLDYSITTNDQLRDASAFEPLVIAYRNGAPVRLSEVARVVDGVEDAEVGAWVDGRPAVVLDVLRQPGANILDVTDEVKALLAQLAASQVGDLDVEIVADRTETIRASFDEMRFTLVLTVLLVVLVMYVFLRSARATIVPGVAVPVSLVLTFGVMLGFGYSLDNLSLMALTIATGFVVDDAIVMVENVARLIEEGKKPLEAALLGAKQIGFTIVSLTLSLVAVLIPLLFMEGMVGRLFREFAVTLATSIVLSALVSLTLTAMMSATLLKAEPPEESRSWLVRLFERAMRWTTKLYASALDLALAYSGTTLLITALTIALTVVLAITAPKSFFPEQDTGLLIGFSEVAGDAPYAELVRLQAEAASLIAEDPDVLHVVSSVGLSRSNPLANAGRFTITLRPYDEREARAGAIADRLRERLSTVMGIEVAILSVQDLTLDLGESPGAYQYVLFDTDAEELTRWTPRVIAALRALPELEHVRGDTSSEGTALVVDIDRERAATLGISIQAIDETLYDAFGQRHVSTIFTQLSQYRVILEVAPEARVDTRVIEQLPIQTASGTPVPLGTVAHLRTERAPLVVRHQGEVPATTISFDTAAGVPLGTAISAVERAIAELDLPEGIQGELQGTADEFARSRVGQGALILAALIAVFVVLGVLYESLIHPITILSTLPSAGVGAFLALRLFDMHFGVLALIGLVLLIGIVKKNAIMMIDFALEAQRDRGLMPRDAIREACLMRFRPIMMTTAAALLGAIPLAFGTGSGAELRQPLGVSIVGGLLVSQVLTLLTTPVIYLAMERLRGLFVRTRSAP